MQRKFVSVVCENSRFFGGLLKKYSDFWFSFHYTFLSNDSFFYGYQVLTVNYGQLNDSKYYTFYCISSYLNNLHDSTILYVHIPKENFLRNYPDVYYTLYCSLLEFKKCKWQPYFKYVFLHYIFYETTQWFLSQL